MLEKELSGPSLELMDIVLSVDGCRVRRRCGVPPAALGESRDRHGDPDPDGRILVDSTSAAEESMSIGGDRARPELEEPTITVMGDSRPVGSLVSGMAVATETAVVGEVLSRPLGD